MMGFLRFVGVAAGVVLGAFACGDDGKVLGERSHSGGSGGSGDGAGSTSTGGSSARGGSSSMGGASGASTGGTTTTGGNAGGGDTNGGNAGASGGDASTGGSSGGDAGAGGGSGAVAGSDSGGGAGGSLGALCIDRTCDDSEVCVAYRTVGGALTFPDDAGACPLNAHKENDYCIADFAYQCVAQPRCTADSVDCSCGTCPQSFTACRAVYVADWLDADAKLVCEQLAP
jgi:hypothetical protein